MGLILQIAIGVALAPLVLGLLVALAAGGRWVGEFLWFAVCTRDGRAHVLPALIGFSLALALWLSQFF